jgi:FAD/FMN-containing dehydrogenase
VQAKGGSVDGQSIPEPGGVQIVTTELSQILQSRVSADGQTATYELGAGADWEDVMVQVMTDGFSPHVYPETPFATHQSVRRLRVGLATHLFAKGF